MTGDTNRSDGVNRRQLMKAAGAAALATGMAGCEEGLVTPDTEEPHGETPGEGEGTGESPATGVEREGVPVYEVTSRGVASGSERALAEELGVPEIVRTENGVLQYVDAERYGSVPRATGETEVVQDEDSPGGRDVSMRFDVEAIEELPEPPGADEMVDRFESALAAAELHPAADFPGTSSPLTSNATFRIVDPESGQADVERALDTAVYLRWQLDGLPLEGAGAKVRARFTNDEDGTVPTDVRHSFRGLAEGGTVELTAPATVNERYRQALGAKMPRALEFELAEPRLVYLAPPLDRPNDNPVGDGEYRVGTLLPHYEVGARVTVGDEQYELLREFVPATDDAAYVPDVSVTASADGDRLGASVDVSGGTAPYKVQWSLSSGHLDLDPRTAGDPAEIERTILARQSIGETTLTVEVEDANGVTVRERTDLSVAVEPNVGRTLGGDAGGALAGLDDAGAAVGIGTAGRVPGTADTGFRSTDYVNWCRGFVREASRLTSVESDWDGQNVWENDFTPPEDDDYGLDTSDHFFTAIHGSPTGFAVPNNCCDDGGVGYQQADGAWGTYDNEWFSLCSCNVLAPDDGQCGGCNGMSRATRWGDEFDGLHQLQGFQTLAHVHGNFPDAVARNVLGRPYFAPLPVRIAWVLAIENHQPGPGKNQRWKRRGVVMGPVDEGNRCNYWDFFHGNGPVGPDIPASDVDRIWEFVAGVGG